MVEFTSALEFTFAIKHCFILPITLYYTLAF